MTEDEIMEASAAMGRQVRWYQRKVARDCGLTVLPAARIGVRSGWYDKTFELPAEDVTVLEPGEAEYLWGVHKSMVGA